jgi:hypothetical protein
MTLSKATKNRSFVSDVNPSSREAYSRFVKETGAKDISYDLFKRIIETTNKKILDKAMTGRYGVRLPKLGILKLIKVKPTKLLKKIDWGRYKKDGVYTTYKNYHTEGYMYRIFFYLYEKKVIPFGFYNFKLARVAQRTITAKIKENEIR